MRLLIQPEARTRPRRPALALSEDGHFDARAARRALADMEWAAGRAGARRLWIRSDVQAFGVDDVRSALSGLPAPGDYRVVVKPLRYRTRPHLAGLCEFDVGRIILCVPEPFRPFDELVYHSARRKPGAGMRFAWVAEKVRFRTVREVLRFVYLHEWLHWYMREVRRMRSGAETACDRFALRNFRRRHVTVADALDALEGTRMQAVPDTFGLAA